MAIEQNNGKLKIYLGGYEFKSGGGGIEGGYNVSFKIDDTDYTIVSCVAGSSVIAPKEPTKIGYQFMGWQLNGVDVSFPYTPLADTILTANFKQGETCLVQGLGSSSPSSVTFTKSAGWSDTYETVVIDGNTFKRIPTMYRKVNNVSNSQITSFTISTGKLDNTYQPYPCFVKEDGVSVMPYILIGTNCSNSTTVANSITTTTFGAIMNIGTGRNICSAKGSGYLQMDWQIFKLWQDLLICAMETVDTNSGSGITTDAIGIYWGGSYPWIDGISWQGSSKQYAFSYKPSKYTDQATSSTEGYQLAGYTLTGTSGKNITKLGYDTTHEFLNYPVSLSDSSYTSYYCDCMAYGNSATHPVASIVGAAGATYGAFLCEASDGWSNVSGSRLCYRPL